MTDLHISSEGIRFNVRARAIILRGDSLLAVKDKDGGSYYYMVGGRIHLDETSEDAIIRECYEETGVHYQPERLVFVNESFFELNERRNHEIALYYLMKPSADEPQLMTDQGEALEWLPIEALGDIEFYPEFLKTALKELPQSVVHIVTREE